MMALAASTWLLVVCGVGGSAEYREKFDARAQALMSAAVERHGILDERVLYLAERPDEVTGASGRANADGIRAAFAQLDGAAAPGDTVVIVLLGHGSDQPPDGKFNIVGPDMAPPDFEPLLARLADRRVALVNTTSASAGFLGLAGPDRVVITATASLREREEPRFGEYFVEALSGDNADLDKDGGVSMAEAFEYASREVERFYTDAGRLQPEHAMLDDDGDAEGSRAPLADASDGVLAGRVILGGTVTVATGDPELDRLRAERGVLADALAALRARRDELSESDYFEQLEGLVVQIAELDAAIRAREEGGR